MEIKNIHFVLSQMYKGVGKKLFYDLIHLIYGHMDPTLETEPLTHEFHNCGRGSRGHHLVSPSHAWK